MKFTNYYNKTFTSKESISTSRAEWESASCPIDMTQVTDEQMQEFINKFYANEDKEVFFDLAEAWLIMNTKTQYLEDYSKKETPTVSNANGSVDDPFIDEAKCEICGGTMKKKNGGII